MDRAGGRRHQIQVQERRAGRDTLGGQVAAWSTIFSTKASITALSGRELMAAQAVRAEVSHQIGAIYRPEWANPIRAAGYRILFGSRIFNIHSVVNVGEQNRDVLIMASEGLNDG